MKKFMNIRGMSLLVLLVAFVLVVSSCGTASESKEESVTDEKMAEEMTTDDSMEADDMHSEDMMGDDDMTADDMMGDDDMAADDMMGDDDMAADDMMDEPMMTNDGKQAPDFELMDFDGNSVTLADFEGSKLYVKYWASWCSICLAGLDELDMLFEETEDFELIAVVTPGEFGEQSKEDFIDWFEGLDYDNIKIYFDEDASLANSLGVRAFPTSVFIGSDGVLISTEPGHKGNDQIREKIESFY